MFRSRRDEGALVETRHALSLLIKSNEDMSKKIKTWSVTDLVVMTLMSFLLNEFWKSPGRFLYRSSVMGQSD